PGKQPAVCHSLVELIDLYPTVAELAGLQPESQLQGESLVGTLNDPTYSVRDAAFSVSKNGKKNGDAFLLRTEKWSYIQYGEDGADGMELYDMEYDPKQHNNLAGIPIYQPVVDQLQASLKRKLELVRKNDLKTNPYRTK